MPSGDPALPTCCGVGRPERLLYDAGECGIEIGRVRDDVCDACECMWCSGDGRLGEDEIANGGVIDSANELTDWGDVDGPPPPSGGLLPETAEFGRDSVRAESGRDSRLRELRRRVTGDTR